MKDPKAPTPPPPPPPPIMKTSWPDAAPLDGEELVFSISCGNSHLHWATHYGDAEDYNPQIFWRTPHLKEEDMESEDLLAILSRNLPDDPHDHIFGKSEDATAADAVRQSEKRAARLISVYVVSTNARQEALLASVWGTVPSRFFVMRGEDFFKKEEGRYDTMGTDRLATLTGAVHLHGHPALVFDGGTATTYSATDGTGSILGGGIGPGIQSKFRSLTKDTDALPEITTEEVLARVNEAQEKGRPLPTFARNTQEAMMADAFQEFALKGRNVIEHWLEKSYGKEGAGADDDEEGRRAGAASSNRKFNDGKRVICTGGDGDILMQLLQPHYGGVIEHAPNGGGGGGGGGARSRDGALAPRYVVEASKHLIHYGIACVLAQEAERRRGKVAFRKGPAGAHVGKRVAKHFPVEADDGDNVYRGKVTVVVELKGGEEGFRIKYDDGDGEDVTSDELFDMFKLYSFHGEKQPKKAAVAKGKKKTAGKRDRSKAKSSDDEAAVEVHSVRSKPSEEKSNEAQSDKEKAAAKKSKRAKSSEDVGKVGAPGVSADPVEKKTNTAAVEKKKIDGKRVEKAKAPDDAKMGAPPGEEKKSDDEKAGEKKAEEKRLAAEKAKKKHTSDDEKAGGTKMEQKKPTAEKAKKAQEVENKARRTRTAPPPKLAKRRTGGVQKKPAAKKARAVNSIAALVNSSDPHTFVRRRVAKDFDGETYFGTVMEYDDAETPAYWHVEYDDGDEEDYSKKDLIKALKYYEVHGKKDRQS